MRLVRHLFVLVAFCLILGAPAASAAEKPSVTDGREVGEMARTLTGHLQDFLKAIWENEGWQIDPLGRNSPGTGEDSGVAPSTDEGWEIDPLG